MSEPIAGLRVGRVAVLHALFPGHAELEHVGAHVEDRLGRFHQPRLAGELVTGTDGLGAEHIVERIELRGLRRGPGGERRAAANREPTPPRPLAETSPHARFTWNLSCWFAIAGKMPRTSISPAGATMVPAHSTLPSSSLTPFLPLASTLQSSYSTSHG